jgi:hypothetical protein
VRKDVVESYLGSMPPPTRVEVLLSAQDEMQKDFECLICTNIANDPEECSYPECDKLFCKKCISGWLQKSQICPNWDHKYTPKPINRLVKNALHDLRFKCEECGQTFLYTEAQPHMQSHAPVEQVGCPANCGSKLFLEKSAFSLHLCEECPKVPLACQHCDETEILREQANNHECAKYLKVLLNKCKNELQECRAQLIEQKALADGYKDAVEQISWEC